jgi:peptidoglycan/LPS O-acetylase OafA/YrhL
VGWSGSILCSKWVSHFWPSLFRVQEEAGYKFPAFLLPPRPGGLLLLCLEVRGLFTGRIATLLERFGTVSAYLGRHSYSIYLWHAPFLQVVAVIFRKMVRAPVPHFAIAVIEVVGSCVLGVLFARIIEFPVLKFRDRIFPVLQDPAHDFSVNAVAALG